ncbi:malto-oligosyltrehalose trehalohydrolase [Rhizobium sp. FKY42]|uniref:malto-oligosyltrehalose trehalohydrolase n=1 Tax=Rhizobium sp. FKY42 TaxID=2562310 RepID=UPI0010BFD5E2|nr:malto-oligosyltrehalose trehalohydrolase [Rhizobium sp. FKY42]
MTEFTFGPILRSTETEFRFWSPQSQTVQLVVEGDAPVEMEPVEDGWFSCTVVGAAAGTRYAFLLPDGLQVPDPASRFQPDDVHGVSEVIDHGAYRWRARSWKGRPVEELVFYEMHIGAFTAEGTFKAAIDKLDHLAGLGITALQIMPIADFPGSYGWGYDGVMPYAPESSYGRPEDLMALIDAAHERGFCVFLDVVYNHFGPDGNYLPAYAPIFTDHHKTPWGNGINFDAEHSDTVRSFMIENAVYWVRDFRFDGLRLDAVHAIKDDSEEHLLKALARRVRAEAGDRHIHLVVENENNDSDLLERDADGRPIHFTAQWNDDVHHVLHIAGTGETFGYYKDFADDSAKLGKALAEGFVFQGEMMEYRGEARGKPSDHLPPTAFVSFMQNHDQIGNRALGDRMIASQPLDRMKALAVCYLLSPQLPMLFMGEEFGAKQPFPFFCDFNEELNEKVRKGRREEFSRLPGFDADDLPDPTARETFEMAKLNWTELSSSVSREITAFYRNILNVRHRIVVPLLASGSTAPAVYEKQGAAVVVRWDFGVRQLTLLANLADENVSFEPQGDMIFQFGAVSCGKAGPWSVVWSVSDV